MSILIYVFMAILLMTSVFLVLVILAQKSKNDGGMGATLGGGATEAAFGADTGNVLTKLTINASIVFFVLCFALYLAQLHVQKHANHSGATLPTISVPAATPAATATSASAVAPAAKASTSAQPAAPAKP